MSWIPVPAAPGPGHLTVVSAVGRRIAVCNADGTYYAIDDECTHDGGPLDQGELVGHEVECPRHGARFDIRTGRAMCLPAVRPVRTYATRAGRTGLEVDVPDGEED